METDTLANANNSYKKAGELLQQQGEYAREMGKAYLNAGASKGFLGIGSKASMVRNSGKAYPPQPGTRRARYWEMTFTRYPTAV